MDQSGTGAGIFTINMGFPLVSESTFGFLLRLPLPSLQTFHLKFPLLMHPRLGIPVGSGLVAANFGHSLMKVKGYFHCHSVQNLFHSLLVKAMFSLFLVFHFPFQAPCSLKIVSRGSPSSVVSSLYSLECHLSWSRHFSSFGACYNIFPHLELQFSLATVFFFFLVGRLSYEAKKKAVKFCFLAAIL